MLQMLYSATSIEPTYASAYRTKIRPLVELKKYNRVLLTLKKVRTTDPSNLKDIIKQGIILEAYLNKPQDAMKCYKEANDIAVNKKDNKTNSFSEQVIAYCLIFYKGKDSALLYLSKVIKNYKDQKSINQLKQLEKLIKSSVLDIDKKKEMLNGNT